MNVLPKKQQQKKNNLCVSYLHGKYLSGAITFLSCCQRKFNCGKKSHLINSTPPTGLSQCTRLPLVPSRVAHRPSLLMGLWYFFRGGEKGKVPLNVTQILCLWHVSSHSWVISQCTLSLALTYVHTHSYTQCCPSIARTSDHSLFAECCSHCHTEKAIHGSLIPAVLCTEQLAGCRACLYNAAGPSTFHTPEALLATALLLHYSYKIPPHVSFDPFIPNTAFYQQPTLKYSQ